MNPISTPWLNLMTLLRSFLVFWILASLVACGSSSDSGVQQNVDTSAELEPLNYTGPPPQTEEVQQFKLAIWDPLAVENRCGNCHGTNDQVPTFVRTDDINLAFADAVDLVDLERPANSRLVTKVGEGHNCWLASAQACADIMTTFVQSWASATGNIVTEIRFEAPEDRPVGESKIFPAEPGAFVDTVYPVLTTYCSECHTRSAALSQQPFIASPDVQTAYDNAKTRMRLDEPAASRLVVRLGDEGHNCWGDCEANAAEMQAAISAFADTIPLTEVDPELVTSRALSLNEGIVASTGGRVDTSIIARYEFKTGEGATAFDISGVEPSANLTLSGDVDWLSSWGIRINQNGGADGKAQAATSGSRKLHDLITATGEYSIEAWVVPDNVSQGDGGADTARIVSYSGSGEVRNFTLGQSQSNYDFLNRSSDSDVNGLPALATADADERVQATQQHLVATFDPVNGRRLYVNGEFTGDGDPFAGNSLEEWDESFALVLGNEVSGTNYAWSGSLRFLAVHNRALSPEAVAGNFEAGVGARFFLLFNISELVPVPASYIAFEVQQFDDYSYLFNEPFYITLDDEAQVPQIPVEGIRIGVNGSEAGVGQVFAALDTQISGDQLEEGRRQFLSRQGAVIGLEQGPENDEFFLTFERLGDHEFVRVEADPPAPEVPTDIPEQPKLGLRSFAAINASLSEVTQVPRNRSAVAETFTKVRQQLPTDPNAEGFLAAHQMGMTQLAVSYCNALVEDTGLRAGYFPGLDFAQGPSAAFDTAGREALIEPLLDNLLAAEISGESLASQADPAAQRAELNDLIDIMTDAGSADTPERTAQTAKAVCAASMASALVLLQ